MNQMGGGAVVLRKGKTQPYRSKLVRDAAMALPQHVDLIALCAGNRAALLEMRSNMPVTNALTKESPPSQVLADILTYEATRGYAISRQTMACAGSNANALNSQMQAATTFKFGLIIFVPQCSDSTSQKVAVAQQEGANIVCDEPVPDADIATTDSWRPMDTEPANRETLRDRANEPRIAPAKPGHMLLRCMPAHVGQEVSAAVLHGPSPHAVEEAGHKLHIQKAVLAWCFGLL